jgi:hypothetical protein
LLAGKPISYRTNTTPLMYLIEVDLNGRVLAQRRLVDHIYEDDACAPARNLYAPRVAALTAATITRAPCFDQ